MLITVFFVVPADGFFWKHRQVHRDNGPKGVPKGLVETQNLVKGRTPCRPHSRILRDRPMMTAIMLPNEESAMRKLRPRTAPLSPKTALKKRLAAVRPEFSRSSLGTVTEVVNLDVQHKLLGGNYVLTCSEKGNVGKHVQDVDGSQGGSSVDLERSHRVLSRPESAGFYHTASFSYLDLVGDVESVVVTSIREDDTIKSNGHAIS